MNHIRYEENDRRAEIVLTRAEKRNALHPEMVNELVEAFERARSSAEVKVVVLAAQGEVFSAGADLAYLKSLQQASLDENLEDSEALAALFQLIYHFPKPVIAKVNGHAIAGGAGLISVCDFVFAVPEAKIGYTEVRIGFVPAIVSTFLIRKIGEARATNMLLSGDLFTAQDCEQMGLVYKVVPAAQMDSELESFVQNLITKNSGLAMTQTKALIKAVQNNDLEQSLKLASAANAHARSTVDCKKGINAFLNKEKIDW